MSRTTENETVEAAIDAVRKMIHDCPAIKGGLGEFGYQLKANGAIDRIEAAHRREVAEDALNKLQDRFVSSVHDGTIDPYEALKIAEDALAAIREEGDAK